MQVRAASVGTHTRYVLLWHLFFLLDETCIGTTGPPCYAVVRHANMRVVLPILLPHGFVGLAM